MLPQHQRQRPRPTSRLVTGLQVMRRALWWLVLSAALAYLNETMDIDLYTGFPLIYRQEEPAVMRLTDVGITTSIQSNQTLWFILDENLTDFDQITLSICSGPHEDLVEELILRAGISEVVTDFGAAALNTFWLPSSRRFSVEAPELFYNDSISWIFQLGVGPSASPPMADSNLFVVDTDFAHALLVTNPLQKISLEHTFSWFQEDYNLTNITIDDLELMVHPVSEVNSILLFKSYCAVKRSPLLTHLNSDVSTTKRGASNLARAQFLVNGLNKSTDYVAHLGIPSKGALGGLLLGAVNFTTKTTESCQLIYNMSFCSDMAFAVPGNASAYSNWALTEFYDQMALDRYANFSDSLAQVGCNASRSHRYSFFSTCDDCAAAYKNWLCAITIPRCTDYDEDSGVYMPRPMGYSRNPEINSFIQPGEYNEVLPCSSLCDDLVRRCPASLEFSCPQGPSRWMSYGEYSEDGFITCSFPGAVYYDSSALMIAPGWIVLIVCLLHVFA